MANPNANKRPNTSHPYRLRYQELQRPFATWSTQEWVLSVNPRIQKIATFPIRTYENTSVYYTPEFRHDKGKHFRDTDNTHIEGIDLQIK